MIRIRRINTYYTEEKNKKINNEKMNKYNIKSNVSFADIEKSKMV